MTVTRPWPGSTVTRPYPIPPPGGCTLWLICDTHIGESQGYAWPRMQAAGQDHQTGLIGSFVDGYVHGGDITNNSGSDSDPEDTDALSWFSTYFADKPNVWVPGNHDIRQRPNHSVQEWSAVYGRPGNTVTDVGSGASAMRVLGFSADTNEMSVDDGSTPPPDTGWTLTDATLEWLDEQLAASSVPCWLACHYPLSDQYQGDTSGGCQPHDQLVDLISSHDTAAGWLSGHLHWDVGRDVMAVTRTVGSKARFPMVCGPSTRYNATLTGTLDPATGQNYPGGQALPINSLYVTYLGDEVQVRYRSHAAKRWAEGHGAVHTTRLPLAAGSDLYGATYVNLY